MAGVCRYNRGLTGAYMDFSGFFSEQKINYTFYIDFSCLAYYLFNKLFTMSKQPQRRIYRNDMPDAQRQAISQKLQGRKLSDDTKKKISKSMTDYWSKLPMKPVTSTGTTSTGNNNDSNINE